MKWPFTLMEEARDEAYEYFDKNIRPLPKDKDGKINTTAFGLENNDIDAFRHAHVSGASSLNLSKILKSPSETTASKSLKVSASHRSCSNLLQTSNYKSVLFMLKTKHVVFLARFS